MGDTKTTVILGGGVGGVVTATTLAKKLPKEHRVIIVDRERDHLFSPSLLWLMTGQRQADKVHRPLERLRKKGIEVRYGDIERIDPVTRCVSITDSSSGHDPAPSLDLDADYLVISLGAELAPETVPGLEEAGHNFYTLAGAQTLRDALDGFDGGRIVVLTATPAYKCPAAPYEAAMLIKDYCARRGLGEKAQVDLYTAEPGPMGVTGAEVSAGVRAMVEDKGIGYHPEHRVSQVDAQAGLLTFDNGTTAKFDLLAYVPPHRAPRVVREAGLIDDSGWIPVDRNTMDTRFRGVYAIGDVVSIPLKMGKPLPMAGVFAEREAVVVAHNVARAITGSGKLSQYDGFGECFVETGGGKAGFGRGNFYADPTPEIKLYKPSRRWHIGKVLFEKNWFRRWL
ncbi:MAG: FAD/NAD(P)-binding oxidoreductase [Acidimicrobiia bacterium]|nr:MAG: FAD/NAD(P)-binding oxidoreductase [Acidimicrobiia bacterium]